MYEDILREQIPKKNNNIIPNFRFGQSEPLHFSKKLLEMAKILVLQKLSHMLQSVTSSVISVNWNFSRTKLTSM